MHMCLHMCSHSSSINAVKISKHKVKLCKLFSSLECPIDFCGTDCYNQCWCNTTVTGNALISNVWPYGCSNLADPSSSPKCNIGKKFCITKLNKLIDYSEMFYFHGLLNDRSLILFL